MRMVLQSLRDVEVLRMSSGLHSYTYMVSTLRKKQNLLVVNLSLDLFLKT